MLEMEIENFETEKNTKNATRLVVLLVMQQH